MGALHPALSATFYYSSIPFVDLQPPQSQFCNRNPHDVGDVYSRRILARDNRSTDHSIPSGGIRQPASARARRTTPHTGRTRAAVNPMTIPPPARSDGRVGAKTVQGFGAGQAAAACPFLRRSATLVIIFLRTGLRRRHADSHRSHAGQYSKKREIEHCEWPIPIIQRGPGSWQIHLRPGPDANGRRIRKDRHRPRQEVRRCMPAP